MKLTFEQFAQALALTESNDNPNAPLGDDGRAAGRWQMHPSFYEEWTTPIPHGTEPSWDTQFRNALFRFYMRAVRNGIDDADAACGFNLSGQPEPGMAARDPVYAQRFNENMKRVLGSPNDVA